ncbi:MAG: transcriptional regulator [Chlorobium sp.]|nr:MAG: transcriptional regulator [Chlorobium sp.]
MAKPKKVKITEKAHWYSHHSEAGYTKLARLLENDIVHTWVDAQNNVVLDFMDVDLLKLLLSESGLENKQFHIIFDLNLVTDISYSYKRAITELLYHWQPFLGLVCFYNVGSQMSVIVESFAAVAPVNIRVLQADSYQDALKIVLAFKANEPLSDDNDVKDFLYNSELKRQFLGAVARMTWLNILDYPIYIPDADNEYYPFFQAIRALHSDLKAKEIEKEKEISLLKQTYEHRITQKIIKMNAQAQIGTQYIQDLEKEVAELSSRAAAQELELTRVSTAIAEKTNALGNLLDQIHALNIDSALKREMTDACMKLLDTEKIEKRLNIELTESDSFFLTKLQKKHPNLNQRELRISLLVKLNYETTEIARSIGISTRGMESIRYRMHKKLGLGKHESIKTYLSDLATAFHA